MVRPNSRLARWRWQVLIDERGNQWLNEHQSCCFNRLMDLGDPVEDKDAATKEYVDGRVVAAATTIDGQSDVDISGGKSDGDVLTWSAGAGAWIPSAPSGSGAVSEYNPGDDVIPAGNSYVTVAHGCAGIPSFIGITPGLGFEANWQILDSEIDATNFILRFVGGISLGSDAHFKWAAFR